MSSSAHRTETEPAADRRALPGLLLVDDDPLIVGSLRFALEDRFRLLSAGSRPEAISLLRQGPPPALALVDLGLPPQPHAPDEGFALIQDLLGFNRAMKILVLSGQSQRANIRHALTLGAVDFIPKPCDAELLRARLAHQLLLLEAETPAAGADDADTLLLGDSPPMARLRELVRQYADMPFPVLIEGESGAGKELVASCLHRQSKRAGGPLLTVNCAAFTPELLDAQLFGHRRGAFTGASEDRAGFFAAADQGSLFLDEIGELPQELQSKLLRVLENGEYYRLGETAPRRSTARVLLATNRDLREAVRQGRFRADLYHRVSVLSLPVPPLRERGADWELLLAHFQAQYARTMTPFTLDAGARALLAGYQFPGNVRELRNIVIRLGAKYPGQSVGPAELAPELEQRVPAIPGGPPDAALVQALRAGDFRLDEATAAVERRYIEVALQLCEGNLSRAARLLNVNRTTLYNKLQRLGLTPG